VVIVVLLSFVTDVVAVGVEVNVVAVVAEYVVGVAKSPDVVAAGEPRPTTRACKVNTLNA